MRKEGNRQQFTDNKKKLRQWSQECTYWKSVVKNCGCMCFIFETSGLLKQNRWYIKDQGKEEKLVIDDETCIVIDPAGQTACRYVDSGNDKELPFERECKKNRFPNKNICCDRNMEMSREFLLLTEL